MGPFLYLTLCSMRNNLRVRARRLRQPRYLVGSIIGVAYFYFLLWRPRPGPRGVSGGVLPMLERAHDAVVIGGALMIFVVTALAWVWPGRNRPALAFSRADVQFLFTAPVTRRQLIRYRVVRSQIAALVGSAFMTVFFRPASLAGGWMFFLGLALAMVVINLHLTGVSLSRESLGTHGVAGLARQWAPVAILLAAIGVLGAALAADWPAIAGAASASALVTEVARAGTTGAAGIVLWPFRAIVQLPLAASPGAFARALPAVLGLILLNYVWVIRSDAAFEEASAELAEKVARARPGARAAAPTVKRAGAAPFALSLDGRPEMAILWKNLILVGRYASLKTLMRFVPLIIVFGIMATRNGGHGATAEGFGVVCLVVFFMTVLMGPQMARNDLRQDLANLAVLKTWPVRGAALVRGEAAAPAVLLTAMAWLAALGGLIVGARMGVSPSYVLAGVLLAPGVIVLQVLAQNAMAVIWPSWVAIGASRARGVDVMGQRMIMTFGMLLVLAVGVLPAAVAGAVVMLPLYWTTGTWPVVIPSLVAAAVLAVEALLVSEAIGKAFDRTDVTAIDATE